MAGPYDITTKVLVEKHPQDWLRLVGQDAPGLVEVIDASLATVVAETDRVLRVEKPALHLVHLEFQASRDVNMGRRLARYNLLLRDRHGLPVLSVVILLRREADGPSMSGEWIGNTPTNQGRIIFQFPVVRVWTEPVERFLNGPLGLLPLAPLADLQGAELAEVVGAVARRIEREAETTDARTLGVVTYTLMGLKYPRELVDQVMRGVRDMRESSTYQAILEEGRDEGRVEGRAAEARNLLLLIGTSKLGEPDPDIRTGLERIEDVERLERMGMRLFRVESWAELLETP